MFFTNTEEAIPRRTGIVLNQHLGNQFAGRLPYVLPNHVYLHLFASDPLAASKSTSAISAPSFPYG